VTLPVSAASLSKEDALSEFNKRFSEIKVGNAEAYYNLAVFCIDNDLPDPAGYLLREAAKDPVFEEKAKRLLEKLAVPLDQPLYESAFKHYESGYLAEAKTELEMLKAYYPQSLYLNQANSLLGKIEKEALDKPYILATVTNNPAEFKKIMDSFDSKAGGDENKAEDLKRAYFMDILKKAEYFAGSPVAKNASGGTKEEYLSYAIKCTDYVISSSNDAELISKAQGLRSMIAKQLFTEHPVSENLENIDSDYEKLSMVKDRGFTEDICGKYIKEGETHLKKAWKASGDEKISDLISAYKCFAFANAYTKSEKLKQDTFREMEIINIEKRKELNKNKTSN
jgi:hypothetical protein